MADPVRCVCGGRALAVKPSDRWFYVYCGGQRNGHDCWTGPVRETESAAVRAWNRLMNAARKEKARG